MFPELQRYPNEQDVRDATYRAHTAIMKRRSFWVFSICGLVLGLSMGIWQALIGEALLSRFGIPGYVGTLGVVVFGMLLGSGGYLVTYHQPMRTLFREGMNADGLPTCVQCGYNLEAAPEARCPECGTTPKKGPGEA